MMSTNNKVIDSTFISRRPLLPMIEIISPASGKKVKKNILSDCVIVGRSEQSDICVDDDKVSRSHFMIVKKDNRYEVTDLNSSNGLVVNGKRIKKSSLTGSDSIIAGNTIFNFILSRKDLERQVFYQSTPELNEFERKYSPKPPVFKRKNVLISMAVGLLVFIAVIATSGGGKKAELSPITSVTPGIESIISVEKELIAEGLNQEESTRALNFFKLAEHHFKLQNYRLAKNSMKNYFSMVPGSSIAPAFIAACEEAMFIAHDAGSRIDQIEQEMRKRELITGLLENAYNEMRNNNYNQAISIFMRVILLDEYNESAYNGLIAAEKALDMEITKPVETPSITVETPQMGTVYARQMERAFKNKNYTRAYELSQRIINMGQREAGRRPFLSAVERSKQIIAITNEKYAPVIKEASLLERSDARDAALSRYRSVIAEFPYNADAMEAIRRINRQKHEEAKHLYARALVERTYPDMPEVVKNLRMILDIVPENDEYYIKASRMLEEIG